ncbi:MAG: signal peptide peptidase SppA [Planctomycetaceae bacterium]|nr:signal peptide peptidase SppA [Planctomycetaceae bacterium]
MAATDTTVDASDARTIIIQQQPRGSWFPWVLALLLLMALGLSLLINMAQLGASLVEAKEGPQETFHSGSKTASRKIARIALDFTIMPPYTDRLMQQLEQVRTSDDVAGLLLVIDSPGGLVSDSHRIYDKLREIQQTKPVYVAMQGICASGGYYIAMGAGADGLVFAEPTTWTGSIGVIIPRYDASPLGEKVGVRADSIVTGPFKDTLNPLKELTEKERELWQAIADEALDRFVHVIDEGRGTLDEAAVRALATGQVYTADQALQHQLIDKIGYESDALDALQEKLGGGAFQVVKYEFDPTLAEALLGPQAQVPAVDPLSRILGSNTPRAMYLFGWQ